MSRLPSNSQFGNFMRRRRLCRAIKCACMGPDKPVVGRNSNAVGCRRAQRANWWKRGKGSPRFFPPFPPITTISTDYHHFNGLDNVAKPPSIAFETVFSRDRLKKEHA